MPKERPDIPLLHVCGPAFYHEPVMIVGNTRALRQLRDAVELALSRSEGSMSRAIAAYDSEDIEDSCQFTSDGEGFDVMVVRCDHPWESEVWDRMPLPYTKAPQTYSRRPYSLLEVWELAEHRPRRKEPRNERRPRKKQGL